MLKLLTTILAAIPNYLSFTPDSEMPEWFRPYRNRVSRLSILSGLYITLLTGISIANAQENKQHQVAFDSLFSSMNALHSVSLFVLQNKLHHQDPSRYDAVFFDPNEVQLQVKNISITLTREVNNLDESLYEALRSLELQLYRLSSFGHKLDSDKAILQLGMVASNIDGVCRNLKPEKYGLDLLCGNMNDNFRNGGFWPRYQKLLNEKRQAENFLSASIHV